MSGKNRVCPVERSGSLDNRLRRLVHNPKKILQEYVTEGMTVLDVGCGPGFFTRAMAEMVGDSGKIIAADLQGGMLAKLKANIAGTSIENRIVLHKSEAHRLGVTGPVDFILAFYMVHEVPDTDGFLAEAQAVLKNGGILYIAEPKFHVSTKNFEDTVGKAVEHGFTPVEKPGIFFSRTVVLRKE
jgi:ubiquinone/menaquinone biosynthesis C-methylase UbiE